MSVSSALVSFAVLAALVTVTPGIDTAVSYTHLDVYKRQLESLQAMAERDLHCLEACLLPMEVGLVGHRRIDVTDEAAVRFRQGQRLRLSRESPGACAVFDVAGRALGLASIDDEGVLAPQRVFQRQDHP